MTQLRYFGTDGVRGPALEGLLSLPETSRWGRAWGEVARARGVERLVIGWDPRLSSEPLLCAFLAGLGDLLPTQLLGVVPTPAVAWLTQQTPGAWGLMVSASHNPPGDNGLKGFSGTGQKLDEDDEAALEAAFDRALPRAPLPALPAADSRPVEAYLDHLDRFAAHGLRIVVDCAHGATAPWAPRLLGEAVVRWIGTPADGARINVGVGSTHLEALQSAVRETGADLGIAFDGDGDRCLMVDPQGEVLDGDQMVWLLARQGTAGVVGTVMSNGGLEEALQEARIPFVRTPVGDKFMSRELDARGWDLAAEASGHVIQRHLGPSGDGLATALALLSRLAELPPPMRWSWRFQPWPLELVNLAAPERRPLEACAALGAAWHDLETSHGSALRLVIRWSGTEPKLRIMGEARSQELLATAMGRLVSAARCDLGL